MEKKSFKEAAGGFLSSWKNDYDQKNKDILERAKKREEEAEAMKQAMFQQMELVKNDLQVRGRQALDNLKIHTEKFMEKLHQGTVTIEETLKLNERIDSTVAFLKETKERGSERFEQIAKDFKLKISGFSKEIPSSISNMDKEIESMKKLAEEELAKQNEQSQQDLDDKHNSIKNLFK